MEELIQIAIAERRFVQFRYGAHPRVGEPHVFGIFRGTKQLLVFQTGGGSNSGKLPEWRRFDVSKILEFELLNKRFNGGRPAPSGKHASWDLQIAFVPQS